MHIIKNPYIVVSELRFNTKLSGLYVKEKT